LNALPTAATAGWGEITSFLGKLGHNIYDPADDEKKNLTDRERREFRGWKHSDLPRFQPTIRKILAYDLDWIRAAYRLYWGLMGRTRQHGRRLPG
jgi:hypothetical protein